MAKKLNRRFALSLLFDVGHGPLFEVRRLTRPKVLGHARGGFHQASSGAGEALGLPPGRLILRQIG